VHKQRAELGEGKPEPFDFLGFTHFCTRSRKWGSFVIGRKTIKKRMLRQLQAVKMELRKRMHDPIAKTGAWLTQMLKGHLNYYAVSGNSPSLWWYFNEVRWRWLKSLKRRSQRAFMSWEKFTSITDRFFPSIRITTPAALSPFRRQNPREEPGALAAHAGIRAGGGEKSSSLPRPFALSSLSMPAAAKLRFAACVLRLSFSFVVPAYRPHASKSFGGLMRETHLSKLPARSALWQGAQVKIFR
jgi:hypothetical protein